jgi:hypothetical protein
VRILAIDPGTTESAYIDYLVGQTPARSAFGKTPNVDVLTVLGANAAYPQAYDAIAIEMIACYGMPVGKEVFDTAVWIGRFWQAARAPVTLVYRREVKMHLCGTMKAKDAHIRQALLDRFGPQGTKKKPGPTYGLKADVWSALAIAVTFAETRLDVGRAAR